MKDIEIIEQEDGRRIYKIDIGDIPLEKVKALLDKIKEELKGKK